MTRRRHERFSVLTSHGMGTYSNRAKAFAAAEWVAEGSSETVSVMNETTGQTWEIAAADPPSVRA